MTEKKQSKFEQLAAVDVSRHIEKKGGLSYLSWSWAVDQLLREDPDANWTYHDPVHFGETMMVSCTVTAFGKAMTMHLPVMDFKNKAIKNPDAFEINKAMMRCLVKAIALHGLGLYIYAGEDLPLDDEPAKPAVKPASKPDKLSPNETDQLETLIDATGISKDERKAFGDWCRNVKHIGGKYLLEHFTACFDEWVAYQESLPPVDIESDDIDGLFPDPENRADGLE